MDWDLMFSQRNNPYCDLLKISAAKINILSDITKYFKRNLYFCGKITKKAVNMERLLVIPYNKKGPTLLRETIDSAAYSLVVISHKISTGAKLTIKNQITK